MRRNNGWFQRTSGGARLRRRGAGRRSTPQPAIEPLEQRNLLAINTLYAVNAGGAEIVGSDGTVWQEDTAATPSAFSNQAAAQSGTFGNGKNVDTSLVPPEVPASLFNTERNDNGGIPMQWDFPVAPGNYEVRLFFAEIFNGNHAVGARLMDVSIEGTLVLDDFDTFDEAGPDTGIMKSFVVSSDSNLDIDFAPVVENPAIKGIEIRYVPQSDALSSNVANLDFSRVVINESATEQVTLTNIGGVGDPDITVQSTDIAGSLAFSDDFDDASGVTLAAGESTTFSVTFAPSVTGPAAATLEVAHSGSNTPLSLSLAGNGDPLQLGTSIVRINAGGPEVGDPTWSEDTIANPSPLTNAASSLSTTFFTGQNIDVSHPSIPFGTPAEIFSTERYDLFGGEEMKWDIPVTPGPYEVRLYFAETFLGAALINGRVFDVSIEGELVLDDYDVFADVGAFTGVMKSFLVTSDDNLDIDLDRIIENPAIKGIEIISLQEPDILLSDTESLNYGTLLIGTPSLQTVTLTNSGTPGDPAITIDSTTIVGSTTFTDDFDDTSGVVLQPGESTTFGVTFVPTDVADEVAVLQVQHSGLNNPLSISLTGTGTDIAPVGFGKGTLAGTSSVQNPTSLQWGPDDRLYVAHQNGTINVYSVERIAKNDYVATQEDQINLVKDIPNHDDDGTPNPSINTRLVTGLMVAGTAANPVIYVASSDPRIGAGPSGGDLNLDTNSGVLSELTWDGTQWNKVDLVRGLPRSEENHMANGMVLDPATNTIYLTQGGNTNAGAPSNNFALLPEYAYAAAILSVDLDALALLPEQTDINGQVYKHDLPTLDDEDRDFDGSGSDVDLANGIQDVFGGNDGKNQAILDPTSPVQVFAPGFRNPYDVVLTESGNLYTIDNGANAGWGDIPILDPVTGLATNQVNEPGGTILDNLQLITGPGYYGGHPNPTRANTDNTFNTTNPQSPVALVGGNALESFFTVPQSEPGALAVFSSSTNGIVEYTASNFGGELQGDLLAANFFGGNSITRLSPDGTGAALDLNEVLFTDVGVAPLDVTAIGDDGPFPGSIWVADWFLDTIVVFEANDFEGGGGPIDPNDLDGDGYSNDDEIANDTDPNSAADVPPDNDGDFLSDLLDDDDDNDSILDLDDAFAIDPDNGTTTFVGVSYTWENDDPNPGGILNLGFTGLMKNGVDNYKDLFDVADLTAGGAAGVLTFDAATEGDALGAANTQEQAFQFGVNTSVETEPFTARSRIVAPFNGLTPESGQSLGLFIGTGDQDNYIKIVVDAGGVSTLSEFAGAVTPGDSDPVGLPGPSVIDLYLTVDPVALTVQPSYDITQGGTTGPRTNLGAPVSIPASWISGPSALAVGIISTSSGPAPEFPATWDFVTVLPEIPTITSDLVATPDSVFAASVEVGQSVTRPVVITHSGDPGSVPIVLDSTTITGAAAAVFSDSFDDAGTVTLQPGESFIVDVTFSPTATGQADAVLEITHDGEVSPLLVPLEGFANSVANDAFAYFAIATGASINGSTFSSGSFQITNLSDSGQKITEVVVDLSTAILPDLVYDPFGLAGDTSGKDFTPDDGAADTGLVDGVLSVPHDGGFDVLTVSFNDFDPSEFFSFSIDTDPTSVQGSAGPGPGQSASVSGFELTGATVTITFDDGSKHSSRMFRQDDSVGESENLFGTKTTSALTVELVGTPYDPTTVVNDANQTVRVSGPVGADISLLVVESGLFTDGVPGGGFDIDPFETNKALAVAEFDATIGPGGFVDVPVTLTVFGADGQLNTLVAITRDPDLQAGPFSPPLVVKVDTSVNTTPTVVSPIGSVVANENDPDTIIDLTTVFSDVEDGTNLTYTVQSNDNPTLVDASIATSTLTLDYLADQSGSATIVVRATDSGGLFVEDTISLTVSPDTPTVLNLESGLLAGVSTDAWTTVTLANAYTSMVVVATPNYGATSPPLVTRIQNAAGNSFQVMVQRADGLSDVATADVHFFVVEEGTYTVAEHGVKLEAVKYVSTSTDRAGDWGGQAQTYANAYTAPVVVGQVMTFNDPAFSTFWSKGSSVQSPPSPTALSTGKHVGEDPVDRADETIGYVVFEAGSGSIGTLEFAAGLGPNEASGVTHAAPAVYSYAGPATPTAAVVSQAGMNGGNGGWALLSGANPLTATTLNVSTDEDQINDAERFHIPEEVAFVVFGTGLVLETQTTQVTPVSSTPLVLETTTTVTTEEVPFFIDLAGTTTTISQPEVEPTPPVETVPDDNAGASANSEAAVDSVLESYEPEPLATDSIDDVAESEDLETRIRQRFGLDGAPINRFQLALERALRQLFGK